jgi:hypothetical protein
MCEMNDFIPPVLLRNPHLQSLLSGAKLRREPISSSAGAVVMADSTDVESGVEKDAYRESAVERVLNPVLHFSNYRREKDDKKYSDCRG